MIIEHNVTTGKIIERKPNADEIAQQEIDKIAVETSKKQYEEAEIKRKALLAKLGITEDEAKLLLS